MIAVFPLFWTVLFTAVLFAYDKLKAKPPPIGLTPSAWVVITLDLLHAHDKGTVSSGNIYTDKINDPACALQALVVIRIGLYK